MRIWCLYLGSASVKVIREGSRLMYLRPATLALVGEKLQERAEKPSRSDLGTMYLA